MACRGFPQAIETVFPQALVQLCIVHLVRASLNYVSWKERKPTAQQLKAISRAATAAASFTPTQAPRHSTVRDYGPDGREPTTSRWAEATS
jgi:hypothetical protein